LLAIIWLGTGVAISFKFSLLSNPSIYTDILPKANIGVSLALIFLCQISYSRIHNSSIYIMGILLGLNGLAINLQPAGFTNFVFTPDYSLYFQLYMFLCLVLVCVLPKSLKYVTVKKITIGLCLVYFVGLLLWPRISLEVMPLFINDSGLPQPAFTTTGYLLPVICFVLTVLFMRNQFSLGGVFSGMAVLFSGIWLRESYLADSISYLAIGESLVPVYLFLGIIAHWIAKVSHNIAIDPLMQIYNRTYCNDIINEQSNINTSPPFSISMVDIDHFKKVNDVHGHQAGDVVLKRVAQTLKNSLGRDGIMCRYGGEEIIVFIPRKSSDQAKVIIEKARLAVKKLRVKIGRKTLKVTISAGISQRSSKSQSVESVISSADKAVYKAKKAGRDRVLAVTTRKA